MSYASNDPTTPGLGPSPHRQLPTRTRLARRGWRIRHSAWLLAPILGFGLFSWIGFVYVAARTRRVAWWITAAVYTDAGVTAMVLISISTGQQDPRLDIGVTLLLIGWLGGTLHAIFLNRDYLRWRATRADEPWYAQEDARSLQPTGPTMTGSTSSTYGASPHRILGVDEADYYSSSPRPDQRPANPTPANFPSKSNMPLAPLPAASTTSSQPTPHASEPLPSSHNRIDLNTSNARALAELPGLDLASAHHIISVRDARGRFHDLDDFVAAVGLQPHQLIKLKPYVVVDDAANQAQQARTGRILDL